MKAHVPLVALALLAATQAFAQSPSSAASAGSYDWGQSQVQKLYGSPYARPSDALAATAERKRLTESRAAGEEEKQARTTSRKPGGSGKLACHGSGPTASGKGCNTGGASGLPLPQQHRLKH